MFKVNHQLDYSKCTVDELRKFHKSRTGKDTTAQSATYLIGKLKVLDKNATFRFMALPPEMRLLVYAELLHRPDPFDKKTIHSQILATSKVINIEAEPELNEKGNMVIRIQPNYPSRGTVCSMGSKTMRLFNVDGMPVADALWPLYDQLCLITAKIQHITIHISLGDPQRVAFFPEPDQNRIAQYLFTLTAALRTSDLRTLRLRLDTGSVKDAEGVLWPLHRIKSQVAFTMENVSSITEDRIILNRSVEDFKPDSISKGKELMTRLDELMTLAPHFNDTRISSKIKGVRDYVLRAMRWTRYSVSDVKAMRRLNKAHATLGAAGLRKSIQKAEDVLKVKEALTAKKSSKTREPSSEPE